MLYDDLSTIEKGVMGEGYFKSLVQDRKHTFEGLNSKIQLRDYQKEAIGRYLYYNESYLHKSVPEHLMFNMATGSGKTVIMACLMLDLYRKGYRNFIFFTRLGTIVEKTKLNFLADESSKFLFNDQLTVDGQVVRVKQVSNFDGTNENDLNVVFATTADLHYKLQNPSEGSITFEDLATRKIALIADEAHNLSADTARNLSTEASVLKASWEGTVMKLLMQNPSENVLLEFTATARLDSSNPEILEKYKDKAIYRYDLRQYRLDGYSKDVNTLEIDAPLFERVLAAIVISQFRLKVAESFKLRLKPVILFKANRVNAPSQSFQDTEVDEAIVVSGHFKDSFHRFIDDLKPIDIQKISEIDNPLIRKAFDFFSSQDLTFENLVSELKIDFSATNCLTVDDGQPIESKQALLNSLEDRENHIRAIFATQKLNEGWDVLNLFDIVRLYNSRDARGNKAGASTVEEAQLIGRGARYFPFKYGEGQPFMQRKFDSDTKNDLRILEELHYHSKTNSRYIQELKSVLTETGILAERSITERVYVKDDVRNSKHWEKGLIYVNTREKTATHPFGSNINESQLVFDTTQPLNTFRLSTRLARQSSIFESDASFENADPAATKTVKLLSLGGHVIRTALWDLPSGSFAELKKVFGRLETILEFITKENYLGGLSVSISGTANQLDNLRPEDKREVARFVLGKILSEIHNDDSGYIGSKVFTPKKLSDIFATDKELKLEDGSERSKKVSGYDLLTEDWFAQNEIWGTSEEKGFLDFFRACLAQLKESFSDIILFRNEQHFPIFAFEDGAAFYPDFVLFMTQKNVSKPIGLQVFIEPKGDQFLDDSKTFEKSGEGWKQKFLLGIQSDHRIVIESDKHVLIGLPFFNSGNLNPDLRVRFAESFNLLYVKDLEDSRTDS